MVVAATSPYRRDVAPTLLDPVPARCPDPRRDGTRIDAAHARELRRRWAAVLVGSVAVAASGSAAMFLALAAWT